MFESLNAFAFVIGWAFLAVTALILASTFIVSSIAYFLWYTQYEKEIRAEIRASRIRFALLVDTYGLWYWCLVVLMHFVLKVLIEISLLAGITEVELQDRLSVSPAEFSELSNWRIFEKMQFREIYDSNFLHG